MSRISTILTTPAAMVADLPAEPEAPAPAPSRKPSKPDAAKADVAAQIEETP